MAMADFVLSARLVATILTYRVAMVLLGAVYNPLAETVPTHGSTDHVTAVSGLPVIRTLNL